MHNEQLLTKYAIPYNAAIYYYCYCCCSSPKRPIMGVTSYALSSRWLA